MDHLNNQLNDYIKMMNWSINNFIEWQHKRMWQLILDSCDNDILHIIVWLSDTTGHDRKGKNKKTRTRTRSNTFSFCNAQKSSSVVAEHELLGGELRAKNFSPPSHPTNHAGFSWSYQNCLGLSLDFLGPIGFVAANLAANWPQAALVKRDVNPAKTDL